MSQRSSNNTQKGGGGKNPKRQGRGGWILSTLFWFFGIAIDLLYHTNHRYSSAAFLFLAIAIIMVLVSLLEVLGLTRK
jgi:hypothetical protein